MQKLSEQPSHSLLQRYGARVGRSFPAFTFVYALLGILGVAGVTIGLSGLSSRVWNLLPSSIQGGLTHVHAYLNTQARWVSLSVGGAILTLDLLLISPLLLPSVSHVLLEKHEGEREEDAATFGSLFRSAYGYIEKQYADSENPLVRHVWARIAHASLIPVALATSLADLMVGVGALLLTCATAGQHRGAREIACVHLKEGVDFLITNLALACLSTVNPQVEHERPQAQQHGLLMGCSLGEVVVGCKIDADPSRAQKLGMRLINMASLPVAFPLALITGGTIPEVNLTVLHGASNISSIPRGIWKLACAPQEEEETSESETAAD